MGWFNDRAAKCRDTGSTSIYVRNRDEPLPPRWTRSRIVRRGVHHSCNVSPILLEQGVEAKGPSVEFLPTPAQQATIEVTALLLICRRELVPEERSVLDHVSPMSLVGVSRDV